MRTCTDRYRNGGVKKWQKQRTIEVSRIRVQTREFAVKQSHMHTSIAGRT